MIEEQFFSYWALLLGLGAAAFVMSLLGTWGLIGVLVKRAVVALPNERSMHVVPVPTGGGAVIVVLILLALIALPLITNIPFNPALVMGMTILAVVSWFDDTKGLTAGKRMLAHFAVVISGLLIAIEPDRAVLTPEFPLWLDRVLTGFCWLWFINLFNFMDGIDGLAGSETVTVMAGLVVISVFVALPAELVLLAVGVLAATLGFLRWNWRPARIYLGDTGAIPLGFLLGWMLIRLAQEGYLVAALLLPLSFVADATLTLLRRLSNGERIWQAHRSHLYQRAALKLNDHAAVVLRFAAANLLLIVVAVLSISYPLFGAVAGVLVTAGLLWHLRQVAAGSERNGE